MNKYVLGLLVALLGGSVSTVEAGPFKNRGCFGGSGCYGGGCHGGGCHGGMAYGYGGCHGGIAYGCHGGCHGGIAGARYAYSGMPAAYYTYGGMPTYNTYRYVYPVANGPIVNGYPVVNVYPSVAGPVITTDRALPVRDNGNGRSEQIALPEEANGPAPAAINVQIPADATITIDGVPTRLTSTRRVFETPPLDRNKEFQYTLRAELTRNGQTQVVTERVTIRGGQEKNVLIDFSTATNR